MLLRPLSSIRPPLVGIFSPLSSSSPKSTVRSRASFPLSHHSRTKMTTTATENDSVEPPQKQEVSDSDPIIQYVVLRRDLIDKWPLGSIITQGCHASVAAIWTHRDHIDTAKYCSPADLDSMHKVTLEVKGEQQMRNLSEKLTAGGIEHKLWIEQPENIPTCIATRPYQKSQIASFFKKLKLCNSSFEQCQSNRALVLSSPVGYVEVQPSTQLSSTGQDTPSCTNHYIPCVGERFKSYENARKSYFDYASCVGFNVRKGSTKIVDGKLVLKRFLCCKEGDEALNLLSGLAVVRGDAGGSGVHDARSTSNTCKEKLGDSSETRRVS